MIVNAGSSNRSRRRHRGAFTACEVALAVFLLAVAMTTTVQVLGWVASERRAVERRQLAIQEVANLMEHVTAQPWDQVTPDSARALSLSEEIRRALPGPELTIDVQESDAPLAEKRVAIRLRWHNRAGLWEAPVRLSAWIARPRSSR
jgi:Tfp pilus assembly protein PilV